MPGILPLRDLIFIHDIFLNSLWLLSRNGEHPKVLPGWGTSTCPPGLFNFSDPRVISIIKRSYLANLTPPIASDCFLLSNMFNLADESSKDWHLDIRDDVIEKCAQFGKVVHIHVDQTDPKGNVYVKCDSVATAVASVNEMHGRWFGGKMSDTGWPTVASPN